MAVRTHWDKIIFRINCVCLPDFAKRFDMMHVYQSFEFASIDFSRIKTTYLTGCTPFA